MKRIHFIQLLSCLNNANYSFNCNFCCFFSVEVECHKSEIIPPSGSYGISNSGSSTAVALLCTGSSDYSFHVQWKPQKCIKPLPISCFFLLLLPFFSVSCASRMHTECSWTIFLCNWMVIREGMKADKSCLWNGI